MQVLFLLTCGYSVVNIVAGETVANATIKEVSYVKIYENAE